MASWHTVFLVVIALVVFSGFSPVETKKRKKNKHLGESLQEMCDSPGRGDSKKHILELQAFFDLTKSFACLKIETCSRVPVCFVEETPDLGQESLNDCSLWNLLLDGLKTNRKIEPVLETSMNAYNGGKSRKRNSWDDAVSNLCYGTNVYRFLNENTGGNAANGTSKNSPTNSTLNHVSNATHVGETTPSTSPRANKKRLRRGGPFNSFFRRLKRKQIASGNSSCGGLEECSRICVGQNERLTNSSDCMTFKFRCTTRRMFRTPRKTKGKGRKKNKD